MEKKKEEGYVLVVVSIFLFTLLAFAALAIDVGFASGARTAAQKAADAAALAGAFTFINTPTATQPSTATDYAMQVALSNNIYGVAIQSADVAISVDTDEQRVTVTITHGQDTFFGGVVGQDTANVAATGVAEAADAATGTGNVKPFFIPNTALYDPGLPCTGGSPPAACNPCTACTSGQVLVDPSTRVPTSWALAKISAGTNRFLVKPQDPQNALRPGQFFLINFGGTNPGDLDEIISSFISDPRFCASSYSVLTGNHVGPVNSGIQTMIGCGQGNIDNRDIYVAPGQYMRTDGSIYNTSPALFTAPIWDICNSSFGGTGFCPSGQFPGGTQPSLSIVGFALVFMEGFQSNPNQAPDCTGPDAVGRVVGIFGCGGSGGGGGGGGIDPTETGPFAVPLRLVRVPSP